ncbi:MAG: hypothetical protein Q4D76_18685 [Oscillospiraceae bacterium]|nr:hypothetical protein [Oscillospiraceae bacterium]
MIELTKNYENLANQGMSAEKLASEFINDYGSSALLADGYPNGTLLLTEPERNAG